MIKTDAMAILAKYRARFKEIEAAVAGDRAMNEPAKTKARQILRARKRDLESVLFYAELAPDLAPAKRSALKS